MNFGEVPSEKIGVGAFVRARLYKPEDSKEEFCEGIILTITPETDFLSIIEKDGRLGKISIKICRITGAKKQSEERLTPEQRKFAEDVRGTIALASHNKIQ